LLLTKVGDQSAGIGSGRGAVHNFRQLFDEYAAGRTRTCQRAGDGCGALHGNEEFVNSSFHDHAVRNFDQLNRKRYDPLVRHSGSSQDFRRL
jgi:hypothetical protein